MLSVPAGGGLVSAASPVAALSPVRYSRAFWELPSVLSSSGSAFVTGVSLSGKGGIETGFCAVSVCWPSRACPSPPALAWACSPDSGLSAPFACALACASVFASVCASVCAWPECWFAPLPVHSPERLPARHFARLVAPLVARFVAQLVVSQPGPVKACPVNFHPGWHPLLWNRRRLLPDCRLAHRHPAGTPVRSVTSLPHLPLYAQRKPLMLRSVLRWRCRLPDLSHPADPSVSLSVSVSRPGTAPVTGPGHRLATVRPAGRRWPRTLPFFRRWRCYHPGHAFADIPSRSGKRPTCSWR